MIKDVLVIAGLLLVFGYSIVESGVPEIPCPLPCWHGNTFYAQPIPLKDLQLTAEEHKDWCLFKMEQVMREMSPYFVTGLIDTPDSPMTLKRWTDGLEAARRWDRVAEECWKEYP